MQDQARPLFSLYYGSKLYGTSTPSSDTDVKVVYIPALNDVLAGNLKRNFKERYDADGNKITDDQAKMPDNGIETEHISVHTFVRDFVEGQTYALEIAHAMAWREAEDSNELEAVEFCRELIERFANKDVYAMTSFAQKQVMDYVHRAERLKAAEQLLGKLELLEKVMRTSPATAFIELRLDTPTPDGTILDTISLSTGLDIGEVQNGNRGYRTLELNNRSYLETTALSEIIGLVKKQIAAYGVRTREAAKTPVEWKAISHAIRVYEQAIELLETKKMSFPRHDANYLLSVKRGQVDLDSVKAYLKQLDAEVLRKIEESKLPKKTDELRQAATAWLVSKLRVFYDLK